MKPLSIIVPALNEEHYLPRLLQSIVDQKYTDEFEVIIVDGYSEDRTVEVAESFRGAIKNLAVHSCARGTSRQRNFGANKAQYDNFIFVDADAEFSPGSLDKIANRFKKKQNFVAVPILYPYDGRRSDVFLGISSYLVFLLAWAIRRPIISGMCIITTRQVHERIGGFNEEAKYAEDVDYGFRAHKTGAAYRIFWRTLVRASGRRMERSGRWTIAKTWLKWYAHLVRGGKVTDLEDKQYEYGTFSDKKDV